MTGRWKRLTCDNYPKQIRWTDEYAQDRAAAMNCTVEFADEYTLQLDLDSKESLDTFLNQIKMLKDLNIVQFAGHFATIRQSKSGNYHVTVALASPLETPIRILLQACLGSDIKRELLSYAGMLKGQEHPVLLFRPKETA